MKNQDEILVDNIAYTRRLGWNATRFVMDYLENSCGILIDTVGKAPGSKLTCENLLIINGRNYYGYF